jgi:ATP-binding cassette subfamily F protein 3
VIELSKNGNEEFLGDYDYYVEKKQEQAEIKALEQENQVKTLDVFVEKTNYKIDKEAKKAERQRKRRIEDIEAAMELLETEINEYNELLCDPNVFQDHEKVMEVQTKLDKHRKIRPASKNELSWKNERPSQHWSFLSIRSESYPQTC